MRFLIDENIGTSIVQYLRKKEHNVVSIKEVQPGMPDSDIIKLALKEKRVIITYDQDFGELVFLHQRKHYGVILIRVSIDIVSYHLQALKHFLRQHSSKELIGKFWRVDDKFL